MSGASALAQVLPGKSQKRPDRDFIRDLHVKLGALPSQQTTQALVKQANQSVHSLHRLPPPFAKENRREEAGVSSALKGRTPQEQRVTKAQATGMIAAALQEVFRDKSAPIARVQKIAGVDRKTASAWYHGKASPQAEHLLTLARHIPQLGGEVRRLLCMEAELHEDFQREFNDLVRRYAR